MANLTHKNTDAKILKKLFLKKNPTVFEEDNDALWSSWPYTSLQTQYLIIKVILSKPELGGKVLNLISDVYRNPRANVIFNDEILKAFPLRLRNSWGCLLWPLLLNLVLEALDNTARKKS